MAKHCAWCLSGYTPSVTSHPRWCLNCACLNDAGRANRLAGLVSKWTEDDGQDKPPRAVSIRAEYFIAAIRAKCSRKEKQKIIDALAAHLADNSEGDQP